MNVSFLQRRLSFFEACTLLMCAFLVRTLVFVLFLQHEERYCQPDTVDYHVASMCMYRGNGMTRLDTQKPIYWRTPGYPAFLSACYYLTDVPDFGPFSAYYAQHTMALWIQLLLSSTIPLLVFFLALILTQSYAVARIAAYIHCVHLGFVFASGYLLTDSLGALFFILFMIFFYQALDWIFGEPAISRYWLIILAAISLAIYTWMRPMGQFVALAAGAMLLYGHTSWQERIKQALLFLIVFFVLLFPWFWRNYQLTGLWFFCPLVGLYLNVFNTPRIVAYLSGIPLETVHRQFTLAGGYAYACEALRYTRENIPFQLCGEYICLSTALPTILTHPFLFLIDWLREVSKTTFDLFSHQFVAFEKECFKWDPMVEFITEKYQACLFANILPWYLQVLSWLELFFYIFLWIGIFAGVYSYIIMPLMRRQRLQDKGLVWLAAGIMVIMVVGQTGGFGYARLRLPIEPLIIIGGLWYWMMLLGQSRLNSEKVV